MKRGESGMFAGATAVAVCVVGIVLWGCASSEPVTGVTVVDDDLSECEELCEEALNAGDISAYLDYWDVDAVRLPPDGPPMVGIRTIGLTAANSFEAAERDLEFTTIETIFTGDFAITLGFYGGTVQDNGDKLPTQVTGKFITIWKRQRNGRWKIYRDIFNSVTPEPEHRSYPSPMGVGFPPGL